MKVISIFVAMLLITVYPVGNKWKETSCTVFEDKIHEVNKIGLIGFEDAKIQNYYVNAFCMVAGYGALCFQLKLRNLPLFISLFPLGIFLPELFTPMWLLLTAGPRFFMGASLSFILFGNIATSGIMGNWSTTFLLADVLILGFIGIWINGLPGVFFVGIASYIQIPFP